MIDERKKESDDRIRRLGHADAALNDLRRAGLPREAVALIVTVSDGVVSTSSPMAGRRNCAQIAQGYIRVSVNTREH